MAFVSTRPLARRQCTAPRRSGPRRSDLRQRKTHRTTRRGGSTPSRLKDLDPQVLTIAPFPHYDLYREQVVKQATWCPPWFCAGAPKADQMGPERPDSPRAIVAGSACGTASEVTLVEVGPRTGDINRRVRLRARRVMNGSGGGQARIIVGIDGSEYSKEALRWAVRQAKFTGAALEAVTAWQYPLAFYGWTGPQDFDFGAAAQQPLTGAPDEVLGPDRPAGLQACAVEGHAAQVLVEASAGAELLVVGTRGHGGFADLLLGSFSTYCVHHAQCPVTVIGRVGHTAEASRPGPGAA